MDNPTVLRYLSQLRNLLKSDISVNYHTGSHITFVPCPRVVCALSAVFSHPDPQTSLHVGRGMRLRMSADDTCSVCGMSEYYHSAAYPRSNLWNWQNVHTCAKVCLPNLYIIEAVDQPTLLHILYCMLSVQQVKLSECEGQKTSALTPFFCLSLTLTLTLIPEHANYRMVRRWLFHALPAGYPMFTEMEYHER